jgi:FixJ family two-component response regulator
VTPGKICVIDDDLAVRTATRSLLRSIGWEAAVFASPEAFLTAGVIAECPCLLCDIEMGAANGIAFQRYLRDEGHRVPIIFVTAHATERVYEEAHEGGAICVLEKPVDPDLLVFWINTVIAASR